jgi:uncharacterized protein YjiS (DUF1127 family)
MSCASTVCPSTTYLETLPSFSGRGRSWKVLSAWLNRIALALEKRRRRRQLLYLDNRMLDDIGAFRPQAVEEALKSLRLTVWLLP